MGAMVTKAPGTDAIRFRSTWGQWAWLAGLMPVVFVLTQAMLDLAFADESGPYHSPLPAVVAFSVIWAAMAAAISRWQGATLTAETLRVHSLMGRVIPWSEIDSIHVERLLGTAFVVVYEVDGRRTRLRAPYNGFLAWDRGFDAKYQTIVTWHQALSR